MNTCPFHQIHSIFALILTHICIVQGQQPVVPSVQEDWLLGKGDYSSEIQIRDHDIVMTNGLITRVIRFAPNAGTIALDNEMTGESILRGIKPEAIVAINGQSYPVGGMTGQTNYAFLLPGDLDSLDNDPAALQFVQYQIGDIQPPFKWKKIRRHMAEAKWPAEGKHLQLFFKGPDALPDVSVVVHYEIYDGIPTYAKWLTITNGSNQVITVDSFTSELLAAVEYESAVEARGQAMATPNIHVETDYAFGGMRAEGANDHAVHWQIDPDYHSQVNYRKLTPCLLTISPEIGPGKQVIPGDTFTSMRSYIMPYDSYDRERQGLSVRKMYRTLAPWITENPLMMHARFADWEGVKRAIDQCAEVGFEMVILTFGSGFNIEDTRSEYLDEMKRYADYARSRGVEIGGYSLLASRTIDPEHDVVMPEGERPTFGNSPCIGSAWGEEYFNTLYRFYEQSGFTLLEHDGSYPGDYCLSESHPGHRGFEDSRWNQYAVISKFYQWCREQGIYLNVPDYYYLSGANKCAMGYREVNWSLPRAQQVIHTRQNIYDGSWTKTPSMGWMFVPLTEYHGGGDAATVEPLSEHLDHYQRIMMSNLGGGVQACYRGPRLFDTDQTKAMVKQTVNWFKQHREVLEGDIVHLRRADGRDIDYWLNVNPTGNEKGLLMVFNPLDIPVEKEIVIPLYYTGITNLATVVHEDNTMTTYELNRAYQITINVQVPPEGFTWYVIKE